MKTVLPPVPGPVFGVTETTEMPGRLACWKYVNEFGSTAVCVSGFVTVMLTTPGIATPGAVAEMAEGLMTVAEVAFVTPNFTTAPAWKLEPMMVTCVPPVVGANAGETAVTLGGGTGARYVNAL